MTFLETQRSRGSLNAFALDLISPPGVISVNVSVQFRRTPLFWREVIVADLSLRSLRHFINHPIDEDDETS